MTTPTHVSNRFRDARGFGLFEVTLILAVAALMTAALTPAVLRMVHSAREDAARDEMRALHEAMVGSDRDGTYAFVGDMGRLPREPAELVDGTGKPLATASPLSGVAYGWNGPYLNRGRDGDDYRLDPWGNPYDIGVVGPGQIRSLGPDGRRDSGDDLVFPPRVVAPFGTLIVTIKGHAGELVTADPEGCAVTLHFASEGVDATVVDDTTPFSFSDVHRGLHAVEASCPRLDGGTASEASVVRVQGEGQQATELHVDLGGAAIAAPSAGDQQLPGTEPNGAQLPARDSQR